MGLLAPNAHINNPFWQESFVKALPISKGTNHFFLGIDRRAPTLLQTGTRIRVRCSNPKLRLKLEPASRPNYFKVQGNNIILLGPQKWWPQDIVVRATVSVPKQGRKGRMLGALVLQTNKPAIINLLNQTKVSLVAK